MKGAGGKKILIAITPLPEKGGTLRRLKLWTRHLSKHYEVRVICCAESQKALDAIRQEGIGVTNDRRLGRLGRLTILPGIAAINSILSEYSPDIVISNFLWADFLSSCALTLRRLLLGESTPQVIHYAGDPVPVHSTSLQPLIYHFLIWSSTKMARKTVFIDSRAAETYVNRYNIRQEKIAVIPIGVDSSLVRHKKAPGNKVTFGVVSRLLNRVKNIDQIIQCICEANERSSTPIALEIFGDGPDHEMLKKLAESLNADSIVTFNGWIDNPIDAFDRIDCLLMFSTTEGTPRSILEAALRGVPTIANDVGGISEIIVDGKTGHLVDTIEQFKDRILLFANNAEMIQQAGAEAREYVLSRHSIERETEDISKLIVDLEYDAS